MVLNSAKTILYQESQIDHRRLRTCYAVRLGFFSQ